MGKNRQISRRTVLRGIGTAIALPWLESIMPRLSQAADGGPPRRMAFFSVPNGMHMPDWTPKEEGPLDVLPPILAPLEPLKSSVTRAHRADAQRRAAATRRSRRSRPLGRLVPHGGPSVQDQRQGHPQRRFRGSGGRGEARPPDPLRVARIGLRAECAGGQLRFGLQLRLYVEHLLAHANLADEQGGQSAGRVRPPFRPGRADC